MLTSIGQTADNKHEKTFWSSWLNLSVVALILATLSVWIIVQIQGTQDARLNYVYSLILGITPILASFKGFVASKRWGGASSILGRAIFALSVGILFWGLGELVWSYYNLIQHVAAPYPSVADVVFVIGYLGWIAGTIILTKLAGVNLFLKKKPILWLLIMVLIAVSLYVSYYYLIKVARGGVLLTDSTSKIKVFLDVFYPVADVIAFTFVAAIVAISGKYLGGKLRLPLVLTFIGLVTLYIGDSVYTYTTTTGTFFNADKGDLILLLASGLLSLSVMKFADAAPVEGTSAANEVNHE